MPADFGEVYVERFDATSGHRGSARRASFTSRVRAPFHVDFEEGFVLTARAHRTGSHLALARGAHDLQPPFPTHRAQPAVHLSFQIELHPAHALRRTDAGQHHPRFLSTSVGVDDLGEDECLIATGGVGHVGFLVHPKFGGRHSRVADFRVEVEVEADHGPFQNAVTVAGH